MQTFTSFDEYASALGHADLRIMALARQRSAWWTHQADLDGVLVRAARDGGPCVFEACIRADGIGLLIGVDATGKTTGNGTVFGPRSVLVIPGHTAVHSASLDAISWFSVFIPSARLHAGAESDPRRRIPCRVIDPAGPEGANFREALEYVATAAVEGAFDSNPLGQKDAAQRLVKAARRLLYMPAAAASDPRPRGRHRIPRARIIRRTQQLIERNPGASLTIDDLVGAVGISERTLRSAFHEQFGLSPMRFLRVRVLNAARSELRRADPACTRVTDVTARLGIWEWGRFSRDYRLLFGELPVETLRR